MDEHNTRMLDLLHPKEWIDPEPKDTYNLVVIGGGAGGLISAAGAAGVGARVALIESHLLGGDCLTVGCVPSKLLLRCAKAAAAVRNAAEFGVKVSGDVSVDFGFVMERLRRLRAGLAPVDSAEVGEFMAALEAINLLAEASPGFVWRMVGDDDTHATDVAVPWSDDPQMIANMSVWENVEALHHYVYRSGHAMYLRRKKEWFAGMHDAHLVAWWIPEGHEPTLEEGYERLELLRERGPTPEAFTLSQAFDESGNPIG